MKEQRKDEEANAPKLLQNTTIKEWLRELCLAKLHCKAVKEQ